MCWNKVIAVLCGYVGMILLAFQMSGCGSDCDPAEKYGLLSFTRIDAVDYDAGRDMLVVRDTLTTRLIFEIGVQYDRVAEARPLIPLKMNDFLPTAYAKDCIKEDIVPNLKEFVIYFNRPVAIRTTEGFRQIPAQENLDYYTRNSLVKVPDLYLKPVQNPFEKRIDAYRIELNHEAVRLDTGNYEIGIRYITDDKLPFEIKKKFYFKGNQ